MFFRRICLCVHACFEFLKCYFLHHSLFEISSMAMNRHHIGFKPFAFTRDCSGATRVWLDTRQHSGHSTTMDFMFALAVPISIAGESVASRVSVSLLAGMCDHSDRVRLMCGLVARNVEDYGDVLRRVMLLSSHKV
jgi:hypothetical protein